MADYRVLYYPDFSPDATWLRRVLLLSDSVARIVPSDVEPNDSDDLLQLQDVIPGSVVNVAPDEDDVTIEPEDRRRLTRALELIGAKRKKNSRNVEIVISDQGHLSVAGHVFVHDVKLSDFVRHQLKKNDLLMESLADLAPARFMVVQRDASETILAGLASRIARRLGLDAITDRPMPFAIGALRGVPRRAADSGIAEGELLTALATIMIPAAVVRLPLSQYQEIRDSYSGIREAFKILTTELATRHRLGRIDNASEFATRVQSTVGEFDRQYREYRKSRYVRRFRSWIPMCVGGILSIPAAVATPQLAISIAVVSFAIQVIEKLAGGPADGANDRVFHLLAGVRRDVIKRSGIRDLV